MKYVLDASVGLKTVLPEADSDKAEALVAEFHQKTRELIAPDTYLVECAHALTRTHRKGLLAPADAEAKFALLFNYRQAETVRPTVRARSFEMTERWMAPNFDEPVTRGPRSFPDRYRLNLVIRHLRMLIIWK